MSPVLLWAGLALADTPTINTSLIAQGIRPGAKLGVEWMVASQEALHEGRPDGRQRVVHSVHVEPAVQAWHHWGNATPIRAGAQLVYRRTAEGGRQCEVLLGQGVTYAINAGVTYTLQPNGQLEGSRLAGNWMSASSVALGFGRDLSAKGTRDISWHARPTLTLWTPYTTGVAPIFSLELGTRR